MTAPIVFIAAGLVLTHGPLAVLGAVLFSVVAHRRHRRYGPLLAPAASRDDPPGLPELPHAGSSAGHQPRRRP